ncbi:MAG TPA: amino acid transporter [Verrucomicrobiae bacterium]|nr:amino acid transporter [Verrucomicrobiae bacterium]
MKQDSAGPLNVVPLHPRDVQSLFSTARFQWWITGGWALDLFAGEQTRPHFDTDVAVARRDQTAAQRHLHGWDFRYAVPGSHDPVAFESWEAGESLDFKIHGSWARENPDSAWRIEFLLHEIEQDVWSFRYCLRVQHPLACIGCRTPEGIPYLRPEIALLYKAARLRELDDTDFRRVLPLLSAEQRTQLAADIVQCWPEHPWLALLS